MGETENTENETLEHLMYKTENNIVSSVYEGCKVCDRNRIKTFTQELAPNTSMNCPRTDIANDTVSSATSPQTHRSESKRGANFSAHFRYTNGHPLPCLASTDCTDLFETVQDQAHHHQVAHLATRPYICMICYKVLQTVCFETEWELLCHGRYVGHCGNEFEFDSHPTTEGVQEVLKSLS